MSVISGNIATTMLLITCIPGSAQRVITTVAGSESVFRGEGRPATQANLAVSSVAVGPAGDIFVTDAGSNMIARITRDGVLYVVAGNGIRGFSGDNGLATNASLNQPAGIAVDATGDLFIADTGNHRVRKLGRDGVIRTIAGDGSDAFSGDGGPAAMASLNGPTDVAVDVAGSVFIADQANSRVRQVRSDGTIRTVARSRYFTGEVDGEGGIRATILVAGDRPRSPLCLIPPELR